MPKRKSSAVTPAADVSRSTASVSVASVDVSPSPVGPVPSEGVGSPVSPAVSSRGRKSKKVKAEAVVLHIESEEEAMLDGPLDSPCPRPSPPAPAPKAPRKARRKQAPQDEQHQEGGHTGAAKRTRAKGKKVKDEPPAAEPFSETPAEVLPLPLPEVEVVVCPPRHGVEVGEGRLLYSLPHTAHKAVVLRRPSSIIKSPYLTDVALLGQCGEGEEVLCHTPSLGVGGAVGPGMQVLISQWGTPAKIMRNAIGVKRPRASTHVLHHVSITMPCPNTSTTTSEGAQAGQEGGQQEDSASASAEAIAEGSGEGSGEEVDLVVGLHPSNANHLVLPLLEEGLLQRQIDDTDSPVVKVSREYKMGNCRFDFVAHHEDGSITIVEVKNVSHGGYGDGVRVRKKPVSKKKKKRQAQAQAQQQEGPVLDPWAKQALFPVGDAYRKKDQPISPRALKQVESMSSLVRSGGVRAAVLLFVVQRWDVTTMAVSRGDPVYRHAVLQALDNGVQVRAVAVRWDSEGQHAFLHKWLPVKP